MEKTNFNLKYTVSGVLILGALLFYFYSQNKTQTNEDNQPVFSFSQSNNPNSQDISEPRGPAANPSISDTAEEKIKETILNSQESLNTDDQRKINIISEILKSKNDNDPRLDKELKVLSENLKNAIKTLYKNLPNEARNDKGTLVYLLTRTLQTPEDLEIINDVLNEDPCLSLENCGVLSSSEPHHSSIDQTSLNYPQMVSLFQLEKQLKENPELKKDPKFIDKTRQILQAALRHPASVIQKKAQQIENLIAE